MTKVYTDPYRVIRRMAYRKKHIHISIFRDTNNTHLRQTQIFLHACPSLTACWTSKRSLRPRSVILLSLPSCFTPADMVDVDVYFVQIIREMR